MSVCETFDRLMVCVYFPTLKEADTWPLEALSLFFLSFLGFLGSSAALVSCEVSAAALSFFSFFLAFFSAFLCASSSLSLESPGAASVGSSVLRFFSFFSFFLSRFSFFSWVFSETSSPSWTFVFLLGRPESPSASICFVAAIAISEKCLWPQSPVRFATTYYKRTQRDRQKSKGGGLKKRILSVCLSIGARRYLEAVKVGRPFRPLGDV